MSLNLKRTALGLTLAASSALLLALAFPPTNLGMLVWIGFVPMLLAQHRVLPSSRSALAPALAIGGWMGALLIPVFGGKSVWMSLLPLLIGAMSLLMDKNKRAFHERTGYRWFVLEGVTGWVGLELIRSLIPAIGTWGFVGYGLWEHPWLLQPVSVFGIYGLNLLIMLCNYALAQFAILLFDRKWHWDGPLPITPRACRRWLGALGLLLLGWIGLSLTLYIGQSEALTARVAAIQPNLPRAAHRDTQTTPEQRLAILITQTRQATAQGAQLIVWPEMALGFDPQDQFTQMLRELAAETGAHLVIGYVLDDQAGFRNEAVVLTPTGTFLGVYGKTHPMIASGEPKTISAGTYPVYETPLGRLGTMICFDASFTDVARRLSRQGVQVIAVPSLFGPSLAGLPHTQLVFRAIESRAAIVMSDVAYHSALVDAYGHVQQQTITPEGAQTILIADMPLGTGHTIYARWGDWLGWLSLAGTGFFAFFAPLTLRRARQVAG